MNENFIKVSKENYFDFFSRNKTTCKHINDSNKTIQQIMDNEVVGMSKWYPVGDSKRFYLLEKYGV